MSQSIGGRWHLVSVTESEGAAPEHGVDLVFYDEPAGLRGAVRSKGDGREFPLQSVSFTGTELRLQMSPRPGTSGANLPFLVMAPVGDHFEGGWAIPGTAHLRLKLIRASD